MVRNFKICLQYEGSRYQGWQKQERTENTIQGKLEAILNKLTGKTVSVHGSGRTDAGVHAYGQIANFCIDTELSSAAVMDYINRYLPEDIAVIAIEEVDQRFHSRLQAKGKTYCYRVLNSEIRHIFDRRYVLPVPEPLDVKAMEEAAGYLVGTHDYKAFTSAKKGKKSTVRTIYDINIVQDGAELCFTFYGNGFLYHMIRIIMGTLLEVGAHQKRPEEINAILASGKRENAGPLVPAQGLALMEVHYS